MRLKLYSSRRGDSSPHLIGVQSEDLDMLATLLVCPLQAGFPLTRVRTEVEWAGQKFVAVCELTRPIRRGLLVEVGELSGPDSQWVMTMIRLLLAR